MSELDHKVDAWCEQIHVDRCWYRSKDSVAELKDHLYSEIERLQAEQGMDDEAAFAAATARLGDMRDLEREFSKNRGWLGRLSRNLAMSECGISKKERTMRRVNALIWAALILASAIVLNTADASDAYSFLLIAIFIPLWFASDQVVRRAMRKQSPA